jgi:hypothetical protein
VIVMFRSSLVVLMSAVTDIAFAHRPQDQDLMTPLRWTLLVFGLTATTAVGAFAAAAATTHDDGSGTPEHTVRDFLVSAVAEHSGLQACRYLTARSLRELRATDPRGMSCEAAVSSYARLTLGGERVDSEAEVKALSYRVAEESDRSARVTVSAHGASRTFALRRATRRELVEYEAPATSWRIDSGVDTLLAR